MAESQIASEASNARSSSSEAAEAGQHHDRNAHLLPSRGISLNLANANTSHGRPAAVKHM